MSKYPVIKDVQDDRDFTFQSLNYGAKRAPRSIDLRNHCSPIVDQGQLGSCSANAMASGLMEYLQIHTGAGGSFRHLSRLFLYWQERNMEGTVNEDSGAQIRDGMKALNKIGVCPEEDYPYNISTFTETPSKQAEQNAADFKISAYHRVNDLTELKTALAVGKPVVIGFQVYTSFESEDVARTGKVPVPDKSKEQWLGGHAVLAVGYQNGLHGQGNVIIRNSWGSNWGDKGYCYFPYALFDNRTGIVMDMWTNGEA